MHTGFRRLLAAAAAAAVLTIYAPPAAAQASAVNITAKCKFAAANSRYFPYATDGDMRTAWTSAEATRREIRITLPGGWRAGGLYFCWKTPPAGWELFAVQGAGTKSILKGGGERWLTQYAGIPGQYASCRKFKLVLTTYSAAAVRIAEIAVFSPGRPPAYAPRWQAFPNDARVDLLTFATHPDDEALYLSPPAVLYAAQGKKIQTVFMTFGPPSGSPRRIEAQESVWCLGNRHYPVMGSFPDVKTASREKQMRHWKLDAVVAFMVEQIRRFRPSVIVTHDVRGEYGHGAHMLTQYAAALAFRYAGDPAKYPQSAGKFGTWKAAKLYVHAYRYNLLKPMSLGTRLPAFGNRTALQVIRAAYDRHKTQQPRRRLPADGAYDMRKFGLYSSNVGADKAHASMFEHVSTGAMLRLNPWYNSVVVDRAALAGALKQARARNEAEYTAASWAEAGLPQAIAAAQRVYDAKTSTQAQVDAQARALRAAMEKLVAAEPEPTVTPEPTITTGSTASPEPAATATPQETPAQSPAAPPPTDPADSETSPHEYGASPAPVSQGVGRWGHYFEKHT